MAILEDFESHRQPLLAMMRASWPIPYFNILTRLLPPLLEADTTDSIEDWSEKEAEEFVHRAQQVLGSAPSPREALVELERLFADCDFEREGAIVRLPPP
jgi:hypothetical protein